jgi:hypothetical protein
LRKYREKLGKLPKSDCGSGGGRRVRKSFLEEMTGELCGKMARWRKQGCSAGLIHRGCEMRLKGAIGPQIMEGTFTLIRNLSRPPRQWDTLTGLMPGNDMIRCLLTA